MLKKSKILITCIGIFLLVFVGSILAMAKTQGPAEGYYNLGINFLKQDRLPEAIESFQKALHDNPADTNSYFYLGSAYYRYGRTTQNRDYLNKAIDCFKRVILINPQETMVYYYIAASYVSLENYLDAIIYYQMSLQFQPRDKTIYYGLAYSYYQMTGNNRALEYSRKAIEIDPQFGSAYYLTGVIYQRLGDQKTAISYYQKAAERGDATARKTLESSNIKVFNADTVQPYTADSVKPVTAESVQPFTADTVKPFTAETVKPFTADTVKPYDSSTPANITENNPGNPKPSGPINSPKPTESPKNNPSAPQSFDWAFSTFILWVPGGSYSVDNYDRQTSTIYTSPGTQPKSTITVNKNGTYVWNSAWDAKIITGNWEIRNDGNLNIIRGQEGKTWILERSKDKNQDIYLWDGFTWYSGKAVTLKQK